MTLGRMFSEAHQDWVEVVKGVHVIAAKKLIEFQKRWGHRDTAKHMDLSQAPYWLQADGGDLFPVRDVEDLRNLLGDTW